MTERERDMTDEQITDLAIAARERGDVDEYRRLRAILAERAHATARAVVRPRRIL